MIDTAKNCLGDLVSALSIEDLSNSKMQVDYPPFYPVVFENYLSNYTHWGWVDVDIVLGEDFFFVFFESTFVITFTFIGNLTKFIPESTLDVSLNLNSIRRNDSYFFMIDVRYYHASRSKDERVLVWCSDDFQD